jgi:hypothetical protein
MKLAAGRFREILRWGQVRYLPMKSRALSATAQNAAHFESNALLVGVLYGLLTDSASRVASWFKDRTHVVHTVEMTMSRMVKLRHVKAEKKRYRHFLLYHMCQSSSCDFSFSFEEGICRSLSSSDHISLEFGFASASRAVKKH